MDIGEAMVAIIEEAERQGFHIAQTRGGAWRVSRDGKVFLFPTPNSALQLLEVLHELIVAGLDWSRWD